MDVPAGWTRWMDQLDRPGGWTSWTDQVDGPAGRTSWTNQLDGPAGLDSARQYFLIYKHKFECICVCAKAILPKNIFNCLIFILKTLIIRKKILQWMGKGELITKELIH